MSISSNETLVKDTLVRRESTAVSIRSVRISESGSRSTTVTSDNEDNPENELVILIEKVNALQHNLKYLTLENELFERLLAEINPQCLTVMEQWVQNALSPARMAFKDTAGSKLSMLMVSTNRAGTSLPTEAASISVTHKCDLVIKEMEAFDVRLKGLNEHHHKKELNISSELEELTTSHEELQETMNDFNNLLHTYGEKNLPLEKYVQFMMQWLKKSRYTVDKLRLRTDSLKVEYNKISILYTQKKMIGENLQKVDFDQLEIENIHLGKKIEQQNQLYMNLKHMTCKGNLMVSNNKKILERKIVQMKKIEENLKQKRDFVDRAADNLDRAYLEVEEANTEQNRIYKKFHGYKAPDIMDYIRLKAKLESLKKEIKVWQHRTALQDMAIATCLFRIKTMTGLKELDLQYIV